MGRIRKKKLFCGEAFTDKNISIIGRLRIGISRADIADDNGITAHSLYNMIRRTNKKLGVRTDTQLCILATLFGFDKYGVLDPDYIFNNFIV